MRSNLRNLIIVAVCIAVLGVALLTLKLTDNDQAASSATSSTESVELVSKKSQDIVSMTVINEKGSYTILPIQESETSSSSQESSESDTSSMSSSTSDEVTYTIKELEGCPINTSVTESVVRNGFSLVASKNLGIVTDLGAYGLENPQATVKVSFKDGSSYDYKIGNATVTNASAYYMCGLNSTNVYIVSVDQGLLEDVSYFVSKEILSITNSDGDNEFSAITLSGDRYPQPVTFSADETNMYISSPDEYEVNTDKLSAIENALTGLTADSVEAVNPDEAALEQYGFKNPTAVATFSVNGKEYTLTAGAKTDDGYYVMLDGVPVVYEVSSSSIEPWALQSLFDLRNKSILMPNIITVQSINVVSNGTDYVLNVARTKDEEKSTEDKTYYQYALTGNDGKELDYDTNYRNFYGKLIALTILEPATEQPTGTPILTVTYQYFDDDKTDTIEFYQSGDRRYTAVLNGQVFGLVTQEDMDNISDGIVALENGEAVS